MAQDYARKYKQLPPIKRNIFRKKKSKAKWWLLILFFIVFIFGLIVWQGVMHRANDSSQSVTTAKKQTPKKAKTSQQSDSPKFDFYKILPKEKVWVPKSLATPIAAQKEPNAPIAYTLQVASFEDYSKAVNLQKHLINKGYSAHVQKAKKGSSWNKVWLGPYETLQDAQLVQVEVAKTRHLNALIKTIKEN